MTVAQMNALNVQIWRDMAVIADSESMMKRLAKYLGKLVKEKEYSTLMTKEEFFDLKTVQSVKSVSTNSVNRKSKIPCRYVSWSLHRR